MRSRESSRIHCRCGTLKIKRSLCGIVLAALLSVLGSSNPAVAEIKDGEVLRFLYLKTPCGLAKLTSRDLTPERARFTADCPNKTAFPDGAAVVCTDHHDDRSCSLETKARDFHSLDILRQKEK